MKAPCAVALWLVLAASAAAADEILLLNGDRLTGKIVGAASGKLTIKTEAAGDVSVDLVKVKTFSTDEPIVLHTRDTMLRSRVAPGPDGTVQVVPIPNIGASLNALRRAEQDRTTLSAGYVYGRETTRDTGATPHTAVRAVSQPRVAAALDGRFRDYNLNGDAGLRTTVFRGFFTEAKIELRYDSRPAPGAEQEDLRYLLAVGWSC